MDNVVYFELNNWTPGIDFPLAEPFRTWCGHDLDLYFDNAKRVKEQKLVVVRSNVDMSVNWCITATRVWVEENCPELLTTYKEFLRFPNESEEVESQSGCPFKQYSEENIGITYAECVDGSWKEDGPF